jgi:Ca2+-binding RTX toxin-like protein
MLMGAPLALAVPQAAAEEPTCQGQPATIVGTEWSDRLYGTPGDDVVWLGGNTHPAFDEFHGRGGNDLICQGGAGAAFLDGGPGDDEIHLEGQQAGGFRATADGGPGADTLVVAEALNAPADQVVELRGGDGDDVLQGSDHREWLEGGTGADHVLAGAGDDLIFGGLGSDLVEAGEGKDELTYTRFVDDDPSDLVPEPVDIDVVAGTVRSGTDLDTVTGTECWTGTSKADTLTGSPGDDCLDGGYGAGRDDIEAGAGNDDVFLYAGTVEAGAGDDSIRASYFSGDPEGGSPVSAAVKISGGPGDDRVRAHARRVNVTGGRGHDVLDLEAYLVFESERGMTWRIDVPKGLVSTERKVAYKVRTEFAGFEAYDGSPTKDVFVGSAKDEIFRGRGGGDRAFGGRGRDTLIGHKGRDLADGGPGRDRCSAERRVNCEAGA